ncbi:hypothetical protein V8F33_009876 [Rhypophila sp. PSN 637]
MCHFSPSGSLCKLLSAIPEKSALLSATNPALLGNPLDTMDKLPFEILDQILDELIKTGPNGQRLEIARYATVSRRFQAAIERRTFRNIRVDSDDLYDFEQILSPRGLTPHLSRSSYHLNRRQAIRELNYETILPPLGFAEKREWKFQDHSRMPKDPSQQIKRYEAIFTDRMERLFTFRSTWTELSQGAGQITLNLFLCIRGTGKCPAQYDRFMLEHHPLRRRTPYMKYRHVPYDKLHVAYEKHALRVAELRRRQNAELAEAVVSCVQHGARQNITGLSLSLNEHDPIRWEYGLEFSLCWPTGSLGAAMRQISQLPALRTLVLHDWPAFSEQLWEADWPSGWPLLHSFVLHTSSLTADGRCMVICPDIEGQLFWRENEIYDATTPVDSVVVPVIEGYGSRHGENAKTEITHLAGWAYL